MKYDHYKQNINFERKINHLQSLTGMPMWNGRNPSISQIRAYERRLLEQQSLGIEKKANFLQRFTTGIKRRLSNAFGLFTLAKHKTSKIKHKVAETNSPEAECC